MHLDNLQDQIILGTVEEQEFLNAIYLKWLEHQNKDYKKDCIPPNSSARFPRGYQGEHQGAKKVYDPQQCISVVKHS